MSDDLRVDFTGVQGGNFDPIPPGWYPVRITDVELKESGEQAKNPGSKYFSFEFTVQEGEFENRKLWSNASLLPQALFTLKDILTAIGIDTSGPLDLDPDEWIGEQLRVKAKYKTYQGEQRNEIKGFRAYDDESAQDSGSGSLLPG